MPSETGASPQPPPAPFSHRQSLHTLEFPPSLLRPAGGWSYPMDVAGRPSAQIPDGSGRHISLPPGPDSLLPHVQSAAAGALEALREGRSVVLAGDAGTGKSSAMARVLRELGDGWSALRLRGAASWAGRPFGGLFWLLSELPPKELSNPVYVLQFTRRVLRQRAAGRRLVLAVEHVEQLDAATIALMLQLCRSEGYLMLATVRSPADSTGEFIRWWRDGSVHREELGPLLPGTTRTLLENVAGGPVSSRLVQEVQARSLGNPLMSRLFFQQQLEAGTILAKRGVWVWTGAVSYAGELAERAETETCTLTVPERYAADVLSLSGGTLLQSLTGLAGADAVEKLEDRGLLRLTREHGSAVLRLRDPLLAEAAAVLVPPGRVQDIKGRLAAGTAVTDDRPSAVSARGRWTAEASRRAVQLAAAGEWGRASEQADNCLHLPGLPAGPESGGPAAMTVAVLTNLFSVYLQTGELHKAGDLLGRAEAAAAGAELYGSNDLCAGMVQVLAGRADRALDYLRRAIAQLDQDGRMGALHLAYTAAAYACLLLEDTDAARDHLAAAANPGVAATGTGLPAATDQRDDGAVPTLVSWFTGLCAIRGLPAGSAPDRDTTGERATELTRCSASGDGPGRVPRAGGTGSAAGELMVLAAAALRGLPGAYEALGAGAARCTGPAAQMYQDVARGLTASDPDALCLAAETAFALGQFLTAFETARQAVRMARPAGNRAAVQNARSTENASFRMLLARNSIRDRLPELTGLERRLALGAAAGQSSSELASGLHLSPRTVDWHLGRIFQKLRVSGRSELRECLEAGPSTT